MSSNQIDPNMQKAYSNLLMQKAFQNSMPNQQIQGQNDNANDIFNQLSLINQQKQSQITPQQQNIFVNPFTPSNVKSPIPRSNMTTANIQSIQQREIPVREEDIKGMILPYLQSSDPGVQQAGMDLYNNWLQQRMKTQNSMEQNQQQLGLSEQLEGYKNQLAQQLAQQQAEQQVKLPNPEYQKVLIQEGSQDVQAAKQEGQQATDALQKINRLEKLQGNISNTNALERFAGTHLPFLVPAYSHSTQEFNALVNSLLFSAKPKGINRMTDQDFRMLQSTLPNVGTDPIANANLIAMLKANNQDEQQYANFLQNYRSANNGLTEGAQALYDKFKNENPAVDDNGNPVMNRVPFVDWLHGKRQKDMPDPKQQLLDRLEEAGKE